MSALFQSVVSSTAGLKMRIDYWKVVCKMEVPGGLSVASHSSLPLPFVAPTGERPLPHTPPTGSSALPPVHCHEAGRSQT